MKKDVVNQCLRGQEVNVDVKHKGCVCFSLFVCTEIHSREHQPQKSPLPVLEPLLSSKRDPCRALQLHTIPSLPGNAVPGVLKPPHTHTSLNVLTGDNRDKMMVTAHSHHEPITDNVFMHLRPIGASLFLSDLSNSAFFR